MGIIKINQVAINKYEDKYSPGDIIQIDSVSYIITTQMQAVPIYGIKSIKSIDDLPDDLERYRITGIESIKGNLVDVATTNVGNSNCTECIHLCSVKHILLQECIAAIPVNSSEDVVVLGFLNDTDTSKVNTRLYKSGTYIQHRENRL